MVYLLVKKAFLVRSPPEPRLVYHDWSGAMNIIVCYFHSTASAQMSAGCVTESYSSIL